MEGLANYRQVIRQKVRHLNKKSSLHSPQKTRSTLPQTKRYPNSLGRGMMTSMIIPKEDVDGDSSLYSVSDLDEDNNSDISFTDVPSLITMDEEPSTKANVTVSQIVSQTSPEHSNGVSEIPTSPSRKHDGIYKEILGIKKKSVRSCDLSCVSLQVSSRAEEDCVP